MTELSPSAPAPLPGLSQLLLHGFCALIQLPLDSLRLLTGLLTGIWLLLLLTSLLTGIWLLLLLLSLLSLLPSVLLLLAGICLLLPALGLLLLLLLCLLAGVRLLLLLLLLLLCLLAGVRLLLLLCPLLLCLLRSVGLLLRPLLLCLLSSVGLLLPSLCLLLCLLLLPHIRLLLLLALAPCPDAHVASGGTHAAQPSGLQLLVALVKLVTQVSHLRDTLVLLQQRYEGRNAHNTTGNEGNEISLRGMLTRDSTDACLPRRTHLSAAQASQGSRAQPPHATLACCTRWCVSLSICCCSSCCCSRCCSRPFCASATLQPRKNKDAQAVVERKD